MFGETKFIITGRLDEEVTLRITAVTPYGSRSSSVSIDVTDEKLLGQLGTLFNKALKDSETEIRTQSQLAAADAFVVARKNGEEV